MGFRTDAGRAPPVSLLTMVIFRTDKNSKHPWPRPVKVLAAARPGGPPDAAQTYGFPRETAHTHSRPRLGLGARKSYPAEDLRLDYEAFKHLVREAGERRATHGGLVAIPELRRQVPALGRREFDDYLLTLHREGAIHLLSHVEPDKLSADVRGECVAHGSGALLYWLRWL